MTILPLPLSVLAALVRFSGVASAQDSGGACNPLTATCSAIPGIDSSSFFTDFTQSNSLPAGWTLSQNENVTFGSSGAEFSFVKSGDAPYIWTQEKFLFGRAEVVAQSAPGIGIISSIVLISDDDDEIDWEFSGNNFGYPSGKVQTNYFGKGVTGSYDRGTLPDTASPQTGFHTYTLDWSTTSLTWLIDGAVVRTFLASDADNGDHQYPQTPMKLQLGLWNGGDPSNGQGTIQWATGGVAEDISEAPFNMYVKSARIDPANSCASYEYSDKSGSYQSIRCAGAASNGTSSISSSSLSSSLAAFSNRTTAPVTMQPTGPSNSVPASSATSNSTIDSSAPNSTAFTTLSQSTVMTLTLISATQDPGTTTIDITTCNTTTATSEASETTGTTYPYSVFTPYPSDGAATVSIITVPWGTATSTVLPAPATPTEDSAMPTVIRVSAAVSSARSTEWPISTNDDAISNQTQETATESGTDNSAGTTATENSPFPPLSSPVASIASSATSPLPPPTGAVSTAPTTVAPATTTAFRAGAGRMQPGFIFGLLARVMRLAVRI